MKKSNYLQFLRIFLVCLFFIVIQNFYFLANAANIISIDGNASEWLNIPAVATASSQATKSLKIASDNNYLYFCIQGNLMKLYYVLYLNTDNNSLTGSKISYWSNTGCEYLIKNGNLYIYTKNANNKMIWHNLGSAGITCSTNSTVNEIRILKSLLKNLNTNISLGYTDNLGSGSAVSFLPKKGSSLCKYSETAQDIIPPSIPLNVSAKTISSFQINLSWTASSDNKGVAGYKIFKNGTQISTSPINSYIDKAPSPATEYKYTVVAYDASGNIY